MLPGAVNLHELEELARERLSPMAWGYFASGADDEVTLRRNAEAYRRIELHYRVMVDVAARDQSTRVLGSQLAMPVLAAPTAFQRLAHPDGELATARAVGRAGTISILSALSTVRVEEVVAAATGPVWFQLYVFRDRGETEALVRRVEEAGCTALMVTADAPLLGRREQDVRNQFALPDGMRIENLAGTGRDQLPAAALESGLAVYFASIIDPSLSWRDLDWLRSITRLPLLIKGIVRPDDARRAADAGVAGIVVSNHGGRQLDGAPATIDVLPAICDAVAGDCEILVDGGIRRGTDVVKALALGARAVLIGRPILWGLAVAGEAGVEAVLETLRREIDLAMALCGCPTVDEITRDLVRR